MSDRVQQSVNDNTDGRSGQSVQAQQSLWMSHWLRTSLDETRTSPNKKRDRSTMDADLTDGLAASSRSVEGVRLIETKTFEIVKTNSKIVESERICASAFKYGQHTDEMQALRPPFELSLERGKAVECSSGEGIISRGCHSVGEGSSKNLPKWMKTHLINPNPHKEKYVDSLSDLERAPKMQKCSGIGMFSSQCITSEETETRNTRNDCYSLMKFQNRVHDVGTKRIGTTMDAQTTQGVLITERIDFNSSKQKDVFTSTRDISENGDISSHLHRFSAFSGHVKQQMELQPLINSFDNEDAKASKVTRNNLSAETDTISSREKNLQSGSYSTASTKVLDTKSNLPPWIQRATSSRKTVSKQPHIEIPDINFPALANSPENICPISSKTQTLEMEQPKRKSNFSLDNYPNADPSTRWIKRLKMSPSNNPAQCTKSSNLGENPSPEKASKFFRRILESDVISSEITPTMYGGGKELALSDQGGCFFSKDKNLITEPNKKDKGLLLSHAWVQRWLSNGSRIAEKKPERGIFCEPQISKLELKNIEKGQCPSIAAMALMGRALTCFQPCELQKRGSFTVWNTKAF
ncbi:hypothetical protein ABFS82_02G022100 [Erythranthe guttata]|nr:PREDICTED: uncharacterized protein LOC105957655 [Erythranthe guttata]|eukprot:XP_012837056.1 PREDICTED: uncharacterized protein LOC105957655 [Erythranthe guttata]